MHDMSHPRHYSYYQRDHLQQAFSHLLVLGRAARAKLLHGRGDHIPKVLLDQVEHLPLGLDKCNDTKNRRRPDH